MKILQLLLLLAVFFVAMPNDAIAQKKNNKQKTSAPSNNKKSTDKSGDKKTPKAEKVAETTGNDYSGLTREEKNTMTVCPEHGKRMSLSDNYRANASDAHESGGHPFAKQLNYRRACTACTKAMIKEEKEAKKKQNPNAGKATFERCIVHNQTLYISQEYSAMNYEKFPDENTPNAQQYKFKTYCKSCTKALDKVQKADDKEKSKEKK